jgi:hypothetical protein
MARQATSESDLAGCITCGTPTKRLGNCKVDASGVGEITLYTKGLAVDLFTFRGDDTTSAFTVLKSHYRGRNYRVSISRFYLPAWWQRLVNRFADHVIEFEKHD